MNQSDAAQLMVRLNVTERTGRYSGLLACPHVRFEKRERKCTMPLWHRDRRRPLSGGLDWAIGFLCLPCAEVYRAATGY